jgi:phage shock protein C
MEKKLYRDTQHKVIGGVCSGLAAYFNVDVSIVRVLFLASLILKGGGFLVYIVLLIVLPKKPYLFNDPTVDYKVPPFGDNYTGPMVEKKKSNGSVIAGSILIVMGTIFLVNQFDLIPHIYWGRIWPVILIVIGFVFIFSRPKSEPWKEQDWKDKTEKKEEPTTEATDNASTTDNPPNVQL